MPVGQGGKSKLTLYHRPSAKTMPLLTKSKGVTLVISAQSVEEQVIDIERLCRKAGIKHFHLDLRGANQALLDDAKVQKRIRVRLAELFSILSDNEEKAVLHCSAGIHRTGTMAYTLIRMSNPELSGSDAYAALKTMREDTHKGVGDWRIELAERHFVAYFQQHGIATVKAEVVETEVTKEEKEEEVKKVEGTKEDAQAAEDGLKEEVKFDEDGSK